jgi:hypothetical protein
VPAPIIARSPATTAMTVRPTNTRVRRSMCMLRNVPRWVVDLADGGVNSRQKPRGNVNRRYPVRVHCANDSWRWSGHPGCAAPGTQRWQGSLVDDPTSAYQPGETVPIPAASAAQSRLS